ncbi:LysM peptidoglycan-binding domain-containing protein [Larkinella sp. VNQ87]|uniref:LysM peptidoglycan-binding domain-containing protein n=1 Tax=Larkinella sp. VNQ87 TaxID=3400921 RepID=UPI003C0EA903
MYGSKTQAQGVPRIGNQLEFAGVTIHLTEATQHAVQQEAELLYVNRSQVNARLERLSLYSPVIRPLLAQHSLSDDFLFLALHDPATVSDEPAPEFWALGKQKPAELRIDSLVDERRHPVHSTLAVVNRLKKLYQQRPNWVAVVNQYSKLLVAETDQPVAVPESGDSKTYSLTDPRDKFLIRLLAAKMVLERALSVYHPSKPLVLFPFEETKGKTLQQLASQCHVSEAALAHQNPWLIRSQVPDNDDYTVYVPVTSEQYAELKRQTSQNAPTQAVLQDSGFPVLQKSAVSSDRRGVFYQINGRKGIQAQLFDNRITLAYQGKLSLRKFERYNDLRGDQSIVAGEIYYLRKKSKRAKVPFHIVRRGQSLWAIAQQYGIKLEKLITYNDLNPEQQPAVSRILWLQRKRPSNLPVEYYRAPKSPDGPLPKPTPVLAQTQTDSVNRKTTPPRAEPPAVKPDRLAEKPTPAVPTSRTLATLDSMIAALNKPELPIRSGAAKMIQPVAVAQPPKTTPDKGEGEPEEVSGPLILHTIEKTDTYATVARKYNVTIQQVYLWNNLSAQKPLKPGQALLIDQSASPARAGLVPLAASPKPVDPSIAKPAASGNPAPTDELIHLVQPGENMYRIGLRYKVKPEQVQKWNNLPNLTVVVGMRLVIRKK